MRFKYLQILIHILLWVGAYLVMGYFIELDPLSKFQVLLWLLYGTMLSAILTYGYAHASLPKFIAELNVRDLILSNLAYLFGFSLLESGVDYLFFLPYLDADTGFFQENFASPFVSNYMTFLAINLPLNAAMLLAANFYGFSYNYFRMQQAKSRIEREKLRAELSALKHQINPHFLFNALNALYGMAFENNDEPTAQGIAKLSNMMRYVLYESNDNVVPLSKEIDYIQNYIELQKLRVNDAVVIEFTVKGEPQGHVIAPMIFLPFVENAFKHGISLVNPSRITIGIVIENSQLIFSVVNTKHPPSSPVGQNQGGIGLQNVKKRLALLNANCHSLEVDDREDLFSITLNMELDTNKKRKKAFDFSRLGKSAGSA